MLVHFFSVYYLRQNIMGALSLDLNHTKDVLSNPCKVWFIWFGYFTSRGGAPASTSGNDGLTFNNNDYNVQGVCLSGEVLWTPTILWVDLFLRGNHSLKILNTTRKINNSFFKVFPINQGTWYWSRDFANDVFYVQIMTLFW